MLALLMLTAMAVQHAAPVELPTWTPRLRFGFTSAELSAPVWQGTIGASRAFALSGAGSRFLLDLEGGVYRFPSTRYRLTVGASIIIDLSPKGKSR